MQYYSVESEYGITVSTLNELYESVIDAGGEAEHRSKSSVINAFKELYDGEIKPIEDINKFMGGKITNFKPTYLTASLIADIKTPTGRNMLRRPSYQFKIPLYSVDGHYFQERDNHSVETPRNNIANPNLSGIYKKQIEGKLNRCYNLMKEDIKKSLKKDGYELVGFLVKEFEGGKHRKEFINTPKTELNNFDFNNLAKDIYEEVASSSLESSKSIEQELKKIRSNPQSLGANIEKN